MRVFFCHVFAQDLRFHKSFSPSTLFLRTDSTFPFLIYTHTHTHPFNGSLSGTTQVSRYQKGKTNLDFIGARDSEWQWHQLGHMQIYISLQTNNHASTPPLSFLQAGCPFCCPTNSVKALKVEINVQAVGFCEFKISLNRVGKRLWCSGALTDS